MKAAFQYQSWSWRWMSHDRNRILGDGMATDGFNMTVWTAAQVLVPAGVQRRG